MYSTYVSDRELMHKKIELIKELDTMLDFAKSTAQLEIILYLSSSRKNLTAREIAQALNMKLKTVYDALNKLTSKELVERTNDGGYRLTPLGSEFIEKLLKIITDSEFRGLQQTSLSTNNFNAMARNLVTFKYVHDVMLILALTDSDKVDVRKLAKILKTSEQTLSEHLELFCCKKEGCLGLLKKSAGSDTTYYSLTELGKQEVSKFVSYRRLKNNKLLRALMKVTRSLTPKQAVLRIAIMSYALSITGMYTILLNTYIGIIIFSTILAYLLAVMTAALYYDLS
ncbi:MAG: helix-turn-helix domain-containing protein [Zestosphaera sp.]